eukprot:2574974-Alexandrium_andersonii.AAC.1
MCIRDRCIVLARNAGGGAPAWGLVTMTKEEHSLTEVLRAYGEDGQLLAARVGFGGRAVLIINIYVRGPASPWMALKLNE